MLRRSQKLVSITVHIVIQRIRKECGLLRHYWGHRMVSVKIMRVLIDDPSKDIEQHKETNAGTGYRAFSIPDDIVNKCEMNWPTVYSDRGIWKING